MQDLSEYFEAVRRRERVWPLRAGMRKLLSEIAEFLDDLHERHPLHGIEAQNSLRNRQKLLTWLEDSLGIMCETLADIDDRSSIRQLRTTVCEGVDGVLLSLAAAAGSGDPTDRAVAKRLTGDRSEMMRGLRTRYLQQDPPLQKIDLVNVLLVTNSVEEAFFLFSKIEKEFDPAPDVPSHVLHA